MTEIKPEIKLEKGNMICSYPFKTYQTFTAMQ